jgi:hypothetical protein
MTKNSKTLNNVAALGFPSSIFHEFAPNIALTDDSTIGNELNDKSMPYGGNTGTSKIRIPAKPNKVSIP